MRILTRTLTGLFSTLIVLGRDKCNAFSAPPQKVIAKNDIQDLDAAVIDGRRSFIAKVATASASAAFFPVYSASAESLPPTGTRAPDFNLPNSRGEGSTSLSDLTKDSKWTVLYFYPGAFTQG